MYRTVSSHASCHVCGMRRSSSCVIHATTDSVDCFHAPFYKASGRRAFSHIFSIRPPSWLWTLRGSPVLLIWQFYYRFHFCQKTVASCRCFFSLSWNLLSILRFVQRGASPSVRILSVRLFLIFTFPFGSIIFEST